MSGWVPVRYSTVEVCAAAAADILFVGMLVTFTWLPVKTGWTPPPLTNNTRRTAADHTELVQTSILGAVV